MRRLCHPFPQWGGTQFVKDCLRQGYARTRRFRDRTRSISAISRDPTRSYAINRDSTRSYAISRDPSRSYAILRDPPHSSTIPRDPSRSHVILRDPTLSCAILRDPSRSCAISRDPTKRSNVIFRGPSRSYASRDPTLLAISRPCISLGPDIHPAREAPRVEYPFRGKEAARNQGQ